MASAHVLLVALWLVTWLTTVAFIPAALASPDTEELLNLKAAFMASNPAALQSFPDDIDPCSAEWQERIKCNEHGRIIELNLANELLKGPIPGRQLAQLDALERLNLGYNSLTGPIPKDLGSLNGLTFLSFEANQLEGPIPDWMAPLLSRLIEIRFANNQFNGSLPRSLGTLRNLTTLDMGSNKLSGELPPQLAYCSNLRLISFPANQLSGPIPEWLGNLKQLEVLEMYTNGLSGPIPSQLALAVSLHSIAMDDNQLSGLLPPELGDLPKLSAIYVANNKLEGPIPDSYSKLESLMYLDVSYNEGINGTIPEFLGKMARIQSIAFEYCDLTGPIPANLGELQNIVEIFLDNNQLTGDIPPSLGQLVTLNKLFLNHNMLSGAIPVELCQLTNIYDLNLARNQLQGGIPACLAQLPHLATLGYLPPSLGQLVTLKLVTLNKLFLNHNMLSGQIPTELCQLTNIYDLYLARNQLQGTVPACLTQLLHLATLTLSMNLLTGPVPDVTSTNAVKFEYNGNCLDNVPDQQDVCAAPTTTPPSTDGTPPPTDGTPTDGTPTDGTTANPPTADGTTTDGSSSGGGDAASQESPPPAEAAAASVSAPPPPPPANQGAFSFFISGVAAAAVAAMLLPSSRLPQPGLHHGSSVCSVLWGFFIVFKALCISPLALFPLPPILPLPLPSPSPTPLPQPLFPPPRIRFQAPQQQPLEPPPPIAQTNVRPLSPSLPSALPPFSPSLSLLFSFLFSLLSAFLSSSSPSSSLSIPPLSLITSGSTPVPGIITIVVFTTALVALIAVAYYLSYRQGNSDGSNRADQLPVTEYSLSKIKKATRNFTTIYGRGSFGMVYLAEDFFRDQSDPRAIIKRAHDPQKLGEFLFKCKVEVLARARHRYLVNLLGYCVGKGERILVYEYLSNGTLFDRLHRPELEPLPWETRVSIAVNIACALEYLHHGVSPPLVHRAVTSSNILLAHDMSAKLSDFGIARGSGGATSSFEENPRRQRKSRAGRAERGEASEASMQMEKVDVYGFGVVLLELITGQKAMKEVHITSVVSQSRCMRYVQYEASMQMEKVDVYGFGVVLLEPITGQKAMKEVHITSVAAPYLENAQMMPLMVDPQLGSYFNSLPFPSPSLPPYFRPPYVASFPYHLHFPVASSPPSPSSPPPPSLLSQAAPYLENAQMMPLMVDPQLGSYFNSLPFPSPSLPPYFRPPYVASFPYHLHFPVASSPPSPSSPPPPSLLSQAAPFLEDAQMMPLMVDPQLGGYFNQSELIELGTIARDCVQEDASSRPTMREVLQTMEERLRLDAHLFDNLNEDDALLVDGYSAAVPAAVTASGRRSGVGFGSLRLSVGGGGTSSGRGGESGRWGASVESFAQSIKYVLMSPGRAGSGRGGAGGLPVDDPHDLEMSSLLVMNAADARRWTEERGIRGEEREVGRGKWEQGRGNGGQGEWPVVGKCGEFCAVDQLMHGDRGIPGGGRGEGNRKGGRGARDGAGGLPGDVMVARGDEGAVGGEGRGGEGDEGCVGGGGRGGEGERAGMRGERRGDGEGGCAKKRSKCTGEDKRCTQGSAGRGGEEEGERG
ncbi:unnamed protein product [Closterium sp. NIES-65]|nr:unnamed protein product [Closterium sp. NIES-65]